MKNVNSGRFKKGMTPWNKGRTTGIIAWNRGIGRSIKKDFVYINSQKCIKIPLTKGKYTFIDEEDFERVNQYKWQLTTSDNIHFYAKRSVRTQNKKFDIKLHRFILELTDPNIKVDHVNGNGLDNRKSNIRVATASQNLQNRSYKNKTGFKGVSKNHNLWGARLHINGKYYRLYGYKTPIEAAIAYDNLAKQYFGEFAKTNF